MLDISARVHHAPFLRRLYLDHVGPEVAEQHAAKVSADDLAQVQNCNPRQRAPVAPVVPVASRCMTGVVMPTPAEDQLSTSSTSSTDPRPCRQSLVSGDQRGGLAHFLLIFESSCTRRKLQT
jgi:hypothetical protein